jgi:hypothetical protein
LPSVLSLATSFVFLSKPSSLSCGFDSLPSLLSPLKVLSELSVSKPMSEELPQDKDLETESSDKTFNGDNKEGNESNPQESELG